MTYLLDADVFIRAKNLHYGFDFCPAFWTWLVRKNKQGRVFSTEKVGDELYAGDDELADWAREHGRGFFLKPTPDVLTKLGTVGDYVTKARYDAAAVNIFLQVADSYLIAHALASGHTVVSHEIPSQSTKRIKIPNVCIGLEVKCLTPFEMLRYERARFVLEATS